ncbi:hypothetical protein Tdes44962_MAKER07105 [Teratosphaeria destructans]|uniref:Uncharacterized protein n=1 Tax=Teratosphaeria destructans TaxID=418781 RepID=A0A9W7W6Q9_9PEZI|nr:hypothetical protein Tdes44962_MAKER07105 [Teratosphaeria destructans]
MVRTRHSLPAASTATDVAELTEKQRAALKSLQIDAHDAILSGQRGDDHGARKVYHWRGAVYECQGNEPGDWLAAERERGAGRKRKREDGCGGVAVKKRRASLFGDSMLRSRMSSTAATRSPILYTHRAPAKPRSLPGPREAARRKGYQVCPLSEDSMVNARGKWLAAKVCAMAKLNRRASVLVERYNGLRRWLWERRPDIHHREHSPSEQLQEIPESPEPPWRTKDATTTTRTTRTIVRTTTTTTSCHPSNPRRAALTTTAKGGQPLRWSINPEDQATGIRAEEAIFHGRLEGESKQARRRRIKRELKSTKDWDRLEAVAG